MGNSSENPFDALHQSVDSSNSSPDIGTYQQENPFEVLHTNNTAPSDWTGLLNKATQGVGSFFNNPINMGMTFGPGAALSTTEERQPLLDQLKTMFQMAQGPVGNLPENMAERPMDFLQRGIPGVQSAAGANIGGNLYNEVQHFIPQLPKASEVQPPQLDLQSIFQPSTQEGRAVSTIGNLATGMLPISDLMTTARGLSSFQKIPETLDKNFGIFSTRNAKIKLPLDESLTTQAFNDIHEQEVGPQLDQIGALQKRIKEEALPPDADIETGEVPKWKEPKMDQRELDDLLVGSKDEVAEKIKAVEKKFSNEFGEGLKNVQQTPTRGELAEVYGKALNKVDPQGILRDMPGTDANKLNKIMKSIMPEATEAGEEADIPQIDPNEKLDPKTVQGIHAKTMDALKDTDAGIKYSRTLHESLPNTSPELAKLKADYAPKFGIVDRAKANLTSPGISRVAKGTAGALRTGKMKASAGEIGSESVDNAEALFNKHASMVQDARNKYEQQLKDYNTKVEQAKNQNEQNIIKKQMNEKLRQSKLDALSKYKERLEQSHSDEMRDLANGFDEERERLNLEEQKKYKNLAIAGGVASMLGVGGVHKYMKEKF